jgi:hypothetical protein
MKDKIKALLRSVPITGDWDRARAIYVNEAMIDRIEALCNEEVSKKIAELERQLAEATEALEKLARLGNGDRYGNSDGNVIAQQALKALGEPTGQKKEVSVDTFAFIVFKILGKYDNELGKDLWTAKHAQLDTKEEALQIAQAIHNRVYGGSEGK